MPKNIFIYPFDLISPDGKITSINFLNAKEAEAAIEIENIPSPFKGFEIDKSLIQFTLKSTLSQLGISAKALEITCSPQLKKAEVNIHIQAFTNVGEALLKYFKPGIYIGKLFAADDRRRVRKPDYLTRLLGKTDENGDSLFILGEEYKSEQIIEQPEKARTIAKIPLQPGFYKYDHHIFQFLPTIAKGLTKQKSSFREYLPLHQIHTEKPRIAQLNEPLLVRSKAMTLKTLFARIVMDELPHGYQNSTQHLIEPRPYREYVFEFHGDSTEELTTIPLEFYTLEPFREHFFFSDRNLLTKCYEQPETLFKAFETAPEGKAATFIVKGEQLNSLKSNNWIQSDPITDDLITIPPTNRKEKAALKHFIEAQASYTIVKAMQEGNITSQGIMLSNYLPPPFLKSFLLNERVTRCLQAIYFRQPSQKNGDYFSHEDRSLLQDLAKASVDVYWVDFTYHLLLKHTLRTSSDSGMFVPIDRVEDFKKAVFFGIYGSSLKEFPLREPLLELFKGLLSMKNEIDHEQLNPDVSIALVTGGGPGVMLVGNEIASELNILSCGHAVDFSIPHAIQGHKEEMNPYVQAKMTYRLEQLVVRQSEFKLDFPIFCQGGVGTDFELALERLRTQVGNKHPSPTILFGSPDYWREKITHQFKINQSMGMIRGSEWISNTFFCVQTAKDALSIYYKFFTNRLPIGKDHPPAEDGFVTVKPSLE